MMAGFVQSFWKFVKPFVRLYWRVRRPLTMGVRGLVRDAQGRVLLVRHSYIAGWYLPGGGVERGETSLTSLKRELDEEAGVIVTGEVAMIGLLANFREFKSDHVALYLVEAGQYRSEPRTSFEIAEYGWFAVDALPDGISAATRARIVEVTEGRPAPEMW
tara:strand:+ start:5803 stop:6282 length:480 start_codon:yes stop_codon:yes gene_type:complete